MVIRNIGLKSKDIVLSGEDKNPIFMVYGASLSLENLTLANGFNSQGGAIFNSKGTIEISDSTFMNNHASLGGVIYNTIGTIKITNSTFVANAAVTGGGSIFNVRGKLSISNSTFEANEAPTGGTIYNVPGVVSIVNSTIRNSKGSILFDQETSAATSGPATEVSASSSDSPVVLQ